MHIRQTLFWLIGLLILLAACSAEVGVEYPNRLAPDAVTATAMTAQNFELTTRVATLQQEVRPEL